MLHFHYTCTTCAFVAKGRRGRERDMAICSELKVGNFQTSDCISYNLGLIFRLAKLKTTILFKIAWRSLTEMQRIPFNLKVSKVLMPSHYKGSYPGIPCTPEKLMCGKLAVHGQRQNAIDREKL